MQSYNITLLLSILIFVVINLNNEVLTKKRVSNKKHSNHNKHGTQHHKQVDHQNRRHSNQYKHNIKHHKQDKKNHNLNHKKQHHPLNSKKHYGHHSNKFARGQGQAISHILKPAYEYCRQGQHPRVIGGHFANDTSFPYAAYFYNCQYKNGNQECGHGCGGSIISKYHILTAAHCLVTGGHALRNLQPHEIVVRVGIHNLATPEYNSTGHKMTLKVEKLFVHEAYENARQLNDIGLLKLERPLTFSALIRPVCINGLHSNYNLPAVPNVTMAGWGLTSEGGQMSLELKYGRFYISNFLNCWDYNGVMDEGVKVMLFCASSYSFQEGYTCYGDSGSGPLLLDDNFNPVNILIGLLNGGGYRYPDKTIVCGNPMLFVNMTTYSQWINQNVER